MMNLSKLRCPKCRKQQLVLDASGASCSGCGYHLNYTGKILDFVGGRLETKLDVDLYDTNIDPTRYREIYSEFQSVLRQFDIKKFSNVLELGAGSGAWTVGMSEDPEFGTIYATDISMKFLEILTKRIKNNECHLLCCEAEGLEFVDGSLDLVVGRSFLHHILEYRSLLESCFRWLDKGGAAIFCEPVIQGKVWVAFFSDLIRRLDNRLAIGALDDEQKRKLGGLTRHILKENYHPDIEKIRKDIEDKYIFDIDELKLLCKDVGFSDVRYQSSNRDTQDTIRDLRKTLEKVVGSNSILKKYDCVFESLIATIGTAAPQYLVAQTGYFVLIK
jgi:ubiquinone/menaquinone biosynthesis C-methylase UbiE/ribosomal protein S27E